MAIYVNNMLSKTYKGKIKIVYKDKRKPIVFKSLEEFKNYWRDKPKTNETN